MRGVITGLTPGGRSTVLYDGPPVTAPGMVTLPLDGEVAIAQLFPFDGVGLPRRGDTGEGSAAPSLYRVVRKMTSQNGDVTPNLRCGTRK